MPALTKQKRQGLRPEVIYSENFIRPTIRLANLFSCFRRYIMKYFSFTSYKGFISEAIISFSYTNTIIFV